jgi:sulfoxide reductase heme-binding subunit YedZ
VYVCIHFGIIISLDYAFNLEYISSELLRQPYALVGLTTGLLLIPLVITSFPPWSSRLGKNWKRLHRLVYVIVILDASHFILTVKQGVIEPYLWMILVILLLVLRIPLIRDFFSSSLRRAG